MINKTILLGNVGNNPAVYYTRQGTPMLKFSLCTVETWKGENGTNKRTAWHKCVLFGERAEKLKHYVRTGAQVYVEGTISYSNYTAKDGTKRTDVNILVDELRIITFKDSFGVEKDSPTQEEEIKQDVEEVFPEETDDQISF